jgi:hypothetical protein
MSKEVRADPAALAKLAQACLTASIQLGDGHRNAQADLVVPVAAFGNSGEGSGLAQSCQLVGDELDTTVGRLVAVYENDTDNLYQAAFNYEKADEDAAAKIAHQHRGPGHISFE